jgi:hypothetical protein
MSMHVGAPSNEGERPETVKRGEGTTILTQDPEEMEITERVSYGEWKPDFFS